MKRFILGLLLSFTFCVFLTGCGQSVSALSKLEQQINVIDEVTRENKAEIRVLEEEFKALSDSDKEKLDPASFEKIQEIIKKLTILELEETIEQIGEVNSESGELIRKARNAFEEQTDEVKEQINADGYLEILEAAEAVYNKITTLNDAAQVDEEIRALGEAEEITLGSAEAITQARSDYDRLTPEAKAEVKSIDLLQQAESTLAVLKEQDALLHLNELLKERDYQTAIDDIEAVYEGVSTESIPADIRKGCIEAYLRIAQDEIKSEMFEEAEKTLNRCLDRYAVSGAEAELHSIEKEKQNLENKLIDIIPYNGKLLEETVASGNGELVVKNGPKPALVCLVNTTDSTLRLMMYISPDQTATTKIADGTYAIKYAYGEKWYGEKELFGSETVYRRVLNELRFETVFSQDGDLINVQSFTSATITLAAQEPGSKILTDLTSAEGFSGDRR